jgi:hypothetical protein
MCKGTDQVFCQIYKEPINMWKDTPQQSLQNTQENQSEIHLMNTRMATIFKITVGKDRENWKFCIVIQLYGK